MPTWQVERGGVVLELDTPTKAPPTSEQIRQAFASLPTAKTEDYLEPEQGPEGSALGRFASGAGEMLNPITIAKGLYQTVRHPIDTAGAIYGLHKDRVSKALAAESPIEAGGHALASLLPVLGPMAANIGEQIAETGDIARGVGRGAGMVASVVGGPAAVRAGAKAVGKMGKPLVRSAVKPTVTASRQQAGASLTGINAQADRLAQFIVDNGLTNRAKAEAIISRAEGQIQQMVSTATTATDAPQRATRYLAVLERSAKKQGLPADSVAAIKAAASELLNESPLATDVATTVMRPSPTGLVTASGQPVMVPTQVTSRALRTDVLPDEALQIARGSSKWDTRRSWGEQKGAAKEASKAVERATRDSVKTAVPKTRPEFQTQRMGIQAREALDRMTFRERNREPVSPFDVTTAAVEMSQGRPPVLAVARHLLRENKVKLGVWAKQLERALSTNDEAAAAVILDRLGVLRSAATSPSESRTGRVPVPVTP
jgi:hypothetical protein